MELVNIPDGPNNSVSEQTGLMDEYPGKKDQPEEPNMTAPSIANGCHDNGTRNGGSNPSQVQPTTDESSKGRVPSGFSGCFKWPCKEKKIVWIVNAILVILVVVVLTIYLGQNKSAPGPCLPYIISCSKGWVGYEGRCYNFSSTEGTWDSAQQQCSLVGASLASIDTEQDMEFMKRYKIPADHWFGLRREGEGRPWKWTNGSIFNNWFNIRAKGFCAYLNDEGAFSTRCDTLRNWICTMSLYSSDWEKLLDHPTNTSKPDSAYQFMKINF